MTVKEAAIVEVFTGVCMLAGDKRKHAYEYASELLRRPIYTHEFATLSDELKELSRPDFIKLCKNLADDKSGKDTDVSTNDGWIPVEEALPEDGKKVLAYDKSGEIDIASLYSRDKHMWLVGSMCSAAFDIIAWRTLPEPFKAERSE